MTTVDAARAALSDAMRTALSVGLHEHFDPECDGSPPYEITQEQAAALVADIMRMPVMVAAPDALIAAVRAEAKPVSADRLVELVTTRYAAKLGAAGWVPAETLAALREAATAVVDSAPHGGYINDRISVSGSALDRLRALAATPAEEDRS